MDAIKLLNSLEKGIPLIVTTKWQDLIMRKVAIYAGTDGIATEDGRPTVKVNGYYSQTTARHINDFLYQHGFKTMTKKEMEQ